MTLHIHVFFKHKKIQKIQKVEHPKFCMDMSFRVKICWSWTQAYQGSKNLSDTCVSTIFLTKIYANILDFLLSLLFALFAEVENSNHPGWMDAIKTVKKLI